MAPACDASGCSVATMPWVDTTIERAWDLLMYLVIENLKIAELRN
jgi:hypothetical protein